MFDVFRGHWWVAVGFIRFRASLGSFFGGLCLSSYVRSVVFDNSVWCFCGCWWFSGGLGWFLVVLVVLGGRFVFGGVAGWFVVFLAGVWAGLTFL